MKSFLTNGGNRRVFFLLTVFLFTFNLFCSAQTKDSTAFKVLYPNIPKFSISNYTIYQKSFHVGYERVLNSSHSIYVFGGYNEFPKILHLDLTGTILTGGSSKSGYSFGAEFRFYLPKESRYGAPHGIFLAPYVSYYSFSSNHNLMHTDSSGTQSAGLTLKTGFTNIGVELGYQFVIAKRFVVDCEMFGPSLTFYSFEADLQGHINGENEVLQGIIDKLKERLPLLNDLSNGKKYYSSGTASQKFPFIGFRYAVSIGYAF